MLVYVCYYVTSSLTIIAYNIYILCVDANLQSENITDCLCSSF